MNQVQPDSPQWLAVFSAVEALHQTLQQHNLLEAHPDVVHDFLVLQETLAVLKGDELIIRYWRARKAGFLSKNPDPKGAQPAPAPAGRPCPARRSYLRQETKNC